MRWQWINVQLTLAAHDRQLAEHGGLAGTRDEGLLESALARPQHLEAYGEKDIYVLAAAYGFGIAKNHPFLDGNKRTAYVVTRLFLKLHGKDMKGDTTQRVQVYERLAAGKVTEEALIHWLRSGEIVLK